MANFRVRLSLICEVEAEHQAHVLSELRYLMSSFKEVQELRVGVISELMPDKQNHGDQVQGQQQAQSQDTPDF